MYSIHHAFVCVSRVPSHLLRLEYKSTISHRLCLAPDETPFVCDLCRPRPPSTTQGQVSSARGSLGYRLFVSAFMIASEVICNDTYSNKSWSIVGQGMFQLREINQMEREMCQYLDWELNIEPGTLKEFEDMVRKDFAGPGPYPTYVLQTIAATSTNPFPAVAPNNSTSPIPSSGP